MTNVFVQKNDIRTVNTETLIAGTANAFFIQFSLSSDWDGLHKTAVFSNGIQTINILENMWQAGNVCVIPHEVLAEPNRLVQVGMRGTFENATVFSTPMRSIGKVLPGTNSEADKTAAPTLPVWEQLREDFSTRAYDCTVLLEKRRNEATNSTMLRLRLQNSANIPMGATIHLERCIRNRGRRTYWQHPATWDNTEARNGEKWGYGLIANEAYQYDGDQLYPDIPDWMPQNGFMKTEFAISNLVLKKGYMDLDLATFLVPALKPANEEMDWTQSGFVGLQGDGMNNPFLLRFRICQAGRFIDNPGSIVRIGIRRTENTGSENPIVKNGRINVSSLYVSIN